MPRRTPATGAWCSDSRTARPWTWASQGRRENSGTSAGGGKPGGWRAHGFPARSAYGYAKLNRRRSADLRAVRTGKPGDRSGEIAMTSFNEGQHETRTPGGALAAIAGRAKHGFAQGLTRAEGIPLGIMPDRRIAGSPDRRIAGSPDRRIAGSPDRRIAGSPDRRIAGSPDRRIAGSPDRRIAGSPDRRIAGSPDRRIAGSIVFTDRIHRTAFGLLPRLCGHRDNELSVQRD